MKTNLNVIGIVGKAGSGKDTLADLFVTDGMHKLAVADGIKVISHMLYDTPLSVLWGPSQERSLEFREHLEGVGKGARELNENVWANLIVRRIHYFFASAPDPLHLYKRPGSETVVVPDIRYAREAQRLKDEFNATLVRIDRKACNVAHSECVSEKAVDSIPSSLIDYVVPNDGTLEDLRKSFEDLKEKIYVL